jgi:cholesterol oxidase
MAHWPNKSEQDTRPKLGEAFRVVDSVKPNNPAVPPSASGALRLPLRVL